MASGILETCLVQMLRDQVIMGALAPIVTAMITGMVNHQGTYAAAKAATRATLT